MTTTVTTITCGKLCGATDGSVISFHAIPYAAPPVGKLRFKPPQPAIPWSGERDATKEGAIAPQLPSRLSTVMGSFDHLQSEDCLTLTIWTPALDGERRPVMVWFHGGAWVTGGTVPLYSGARMAARGDVVVVAVNSRLGALGYLYLPEVSPGNLGLLDQFAALRWISREIPAFSGDAGNITIFGQSAGGFTMLAMLASIETRNCFRRAILQSAPFGPALRSIEEASNAGKTMGDLLGIRGNNEWEDVPTTDILEAQREVMRGDGAFANPRMPFGPVADGTVLGHDMFARASGAAATHGIMIGYTREDARAFMVSDARMQTADRSKVISRFRDYFGHNAQEALAEYGERSGTLEPASLMLAMLTDAFFASAAFRFAEQSSECGGDVFVYRFDWSPPGSVFGACHCIDLPFVFNKLEKWNAPMLAGGDRDTMQSLADQLQASWISFARTGHPTQGPLPRWPPYDRLTKQMMLFDVTCRIEEDPAGRNRWRFWP
jgi:para-nitrobenzyl esterase